MKPWANRGRCESKNPTTGNRCVKRREHVNAINGKTTSRTKRIETAIHQFYPLRDVPRYESKRNEFWDDLSQVPEKYMDFVRYPSLYSESDIGRELVIKPFQTPH